MSIRFISKPYKVGSWLVLHLPQSASSQLPSRGQVMVKGTINNFAFHTALEPDGRGGHWLHVDKSMQAAAQANAGEAANLEIESTKEWPEPDVPNDVAEGIKRANPDVQALWKKITPMARWEWIRWINSTKQPETRKRRIKVSVSKLTKGMRRPCCFNRNMCCVPDVSKNGVLIGPDGTVK